MWSEVVESAMAIRSEQSMIAENCRNQSKDWVLCFRIVETRKPDLAKVVMRRNPDVCTDGQCSRVDAHCYGTRSRPILMSRPASNESAR